jgi:hypothetical protein
MSGLFIDKPKGGKMHYTDVRKFFSDVILDPYSLIDLRLVVSWARQDFVNSAMKLRTCQLAKQQIKRSLLNWWGWRKIRKIEKAVEAVHAEIREKRMVLDDLERALEIAENNNNKEMERRAFYIKALEEAENADDERYEKRLEDIEKKGDQLSDKEIFKDIRKQLAKLFFIIDKMDTQQKREKEWQLYGPPSRVRKEFEKFFNRVLCIDGQCSGVIGDNGCCKVCGTPHPYFKK